MAAAGMLQRSGAAPLRPESQASLFPSFPEAHPTVAGPGWYRRSVRPLVMPYLPGARLEVSPTLPSLAATAAQQRPKPAEPTLS